MVKVTLSVREQDHLVKYNHFQPITISDSTIGVNNVNFHIPTLLKEVKKLPKKERTNIKKQILTFQATVASFLLLSSKSMANTIQNPSVPVNNLPKTAESLPPEIMELLITLLVIAVGGGVVLAAILLVSAGIGKMFRMKNASAWSVDILKGVVQILIAPSVIFLIYYLSNLVFGNSGWHINPF